MLTCTKDRAGHFVTGKPALRLIVTPDPARVDGVDVGLSGVDPTEPFAPTKHMSAISTLLEGASGPLTTNHDHLCDSGKKQTIVKALAILVESGYLTVTPGPRNSHLYEFVTPYTIGDPIVVPEDDDEPLSAASAGHRAAQALCTEHEWHAGQPCNPKWCHDHHFGACNEL